MEKKYFHKKIESFVQKFYLKNKTFKVKINYKKKKYYCLSMLPYPSGNLHLGHIRNYTVGDIIARFQRMLGKNVLNPMGWDSFGLPAEEAAIKNKILPLDWTKKNIKNMKSQLIAFGFSYDWSRELNTCKPSYYKWEQLLFLKLYKKNLIYNKIKKVNWCPKDKTVLANEQVVNNKCWRCETKIIYKIIPQWFIKIKKYAKKLLKGIKKLKNWPSKVKEMQRNWIGKKKFIEIKFKIINFKKKIKIYTNKPILLIGTTYIGISICNKKLINYLNIKKNKIKKIISKYNINNKIRGFFTGLFCINPLNKKRIPIWIINYVLNKNNIIGKPNYNKFDFIFAKKYKINIKKNILYKNKNLKKNIKIGILFNSNKYNGLNYKEAFKLISKKFLKKKIKYKLHDWCISRQRYWGVPIPILKNVKNNSIKCFPKNLIPILLPKIKNISNIKYPIKYNKKWKYLNFKKKKYKRELDTFDTFMESSWYYARYTCPKYKKNIIKKKSVNYWLPIDQYIGGIEHSNMHLIYIRFLHKLLNSLGFVKNKEPIKRLLCQGMVLSDSFYYYKNKKKIWIKKKNVNIKYNKYGKVNKLFYKNLKVYYAGKIKMSKSKNNGINLKKLLSKYGADVIRLFIVFISPINKELIWKESGIIGVKRFLNKIWKLVWKYKNRKYKLNKILNFEEKKIIYKLNKLILSVYINIKKQLFNIAISKIMKFFKKFNIIFKKYKNKILIKKSLNVIIRLLHPFTPHLSFFLWKKIKKKNIENELWPIYNKKIKKKNKYLMIIKVNNKLRLKIKIPYKLKKTEILKIVKENNNIKKYIKNKEIKKIFYIPKKIINILVND